MPARCSTPLTEEGKKKTKEERELLPLLPTALLALELPRRRRRTRKRG
jgi:hypothetical protein